MCGLVVPVDVQPPPAPLVAYPRLLSQQECPDSQAKAKFAVPITASSTGTGASAAPIASSKRGLQAKVPSVSVGLGPRPVGLRSATRDFRTNLPLTTNCNLSQTKRASGLLRGGILATARPVSLSGRSPFLRPPRAAPPTGGTVTSHPSTPFRMRQPCCLQPPPPPAPRQGP